MLQIQHIRKEYRTGKLVQKALDDVSLNLRDSEFVAVLGPSGSGKTTLLNIIGGLDRYDSGDLIINGISTKKYKDRDWDSYRNHTIGFVFQSYNLIPHQTVLSNVELALTISGISRTERRKRAKEALEKVGLGEQIHKKPSQMSGGQMQRVAIARALVNNPDILLADEPTGALDSETSVQVMELLKEVSKDRLVVMVTHNPELAYEYATRIVEVKDGKILSDSDPLEIDENIIEKPVHKNMGKSSMSFLTALSLSFQNLKTKKARTLLTSFAGSIGIIGIALILSISNGVSGYISAMEEDTLSEYPLQIQSTGFDLTAMMVGMSASGDNKKENDIGVTPVVSDMFSKMSTNDLASLKTYIEGNPENIEEQCMNIYVPEEYLDKEVTIGGWVRSIRDSKTFGFIVVNDGSFFENLQVVYHDNMENFGEISKLNVGAAIIVKGTLVATPQAKQPFEIQAAEVVVEGTSAPDYPLQKKRHSFEYLRSIAHLRPRTNTFQAVFRVRSLTAYAIHKFFQERGFVYVHTPLITGSDCEGAGEMFQVTTLDMNNVPKNADGTVDYSKDFFGKETNLTVSGQLNGETYAQAFRNIYTFGPTFRAENSNTTRHAAEFWMIEPEIAFADLEDDMILAENMLKYVIRYVMENAPEEMNFFNSFVDKGLIDRLNNVVNSDFARVTYTEAIEILEKHNDKFEYKVSWGADLQTEHERYLTEEIYKRPVFVTDYPKEIKAFYMKMNDDNKTVAAVDCLVPGIGEIIGGSQREDDYDKLVARMKELGLKEEDYGFYLDLRKYGSTRHAGFGLGFERCIMYLTGMSNIRDVIPFPRTVNNCEL